MTKQSYGFPLTFILTEGEVQKQTVPFPAATIRIYKFSIAALIGFVATPLSPYIQFYVDDTAILPVPALAALFSYGTPFSFVHPIVVHRSQLFTVNVTNSQLVTGTMRLYFDGEIEYA